MKVYVINGESYFLINEEISKIIKDSKNITTFDLNINTLEDVIIEAGYYSIFQEDKYIIVKNANFFGSSKLSEDDTNLLMNYLDNPQDNTIIIFVCNEKLDLRKKITKLVKDKYSLKVINNLKVYEIENRLKMYFQKNNMSIDEDSLKYIISNSLNNYDLIMMEVEKLILYYNKPSNISYNDVLKISARNINTNNFLLVDAIVNNDLEKSLELYNDLKIMKVEPTVLISLIARDFRIMYNIKTMLNDNINEYTIMNELGLMDWQLNKYLQKVFPYKLEELKNVLIDLADLDLNIKNGKVDRFIGLELFILNMCE